MITYLGHSLSLEITLVSRTREQNYSVQLSTLSFQAFSVVVIGESLFSMYMHKELFGKIYKEYE